LGLPTPHLLSGLVLSIIFGMWVSSIMITCPRHPRLIIQIWVTVSSDLYTFCSSRLLLTLHALCSYFAPIFLKMFLFPVIRVDAIFLVSVQVSQPYSMIALNGCTIAQAVSRWLPTVAVRVWSCGICGGQSGAGAGFLWVVQFPLPIFIPPIAPQSPSSIIWGLYNRPEVAAVPVDLVPPH
jgi:hypothetical protein